jgi:hypothetical protein
MAGVFAGGSTITDAAIARAQTVLSTAQVQALQEIQQQQQTAAQLRQQIFQSGPGSGPPAPPTG